MDARGYGRPVTFLSGSDSTAGIDGFTLVGGNVPADSFTAQGGGIYWGWGGYPQIVGNTIIGNFARNGGGIHIETTTGPFVLANNIVAFNGSGILDAGAGPEQLVNNCVYGNVAFNYSCLTPGATDIALDPQFVNRPAGDCHLIGTSPCVDGGVDAYAPAFWNDPEGRPRILAAHVDIGAYEKPTVLVWTVDRTGVPGLTTYLKAWLRGKPHSHRYVCPPARDGPDHLDLAPHRHGRRHRWRDARHLG